MSDETKRQVQQAVAEAFGLQPQEASASLKMGDHPRWDSMGHMDLVTRLEKTFGVRFPAHAISKMISIEGIVCELEKVRGRQQAG